LSLRDAWEAEARNWVAWARKPGHDSYWQFHRDRFLQLLPPPSGLALDLGCGEGRFPRDLKARGYKVIAVDGSPTLIKHAREADPDGDYRVADAAHLPLADASVQLGTALLSLHDMDDMDDMEGAIAQAARVLVTCGRLWPRWCIPSTRVESSRPQRPMPSSSCASRTSSSGATPRLRHRDSPCAVTDR